MGERSLEDIVGEVRQLTGSMAAARLIDPEEQPAGLRSEQIRARAARLIEEALGDRFQQAIDRIEADHRQCLNELRRDQATILSRLCDQIEMALRAREQDERALQERAIETTLASVERRLMPEIEELRMLLKQQQRDLSSSAEHPRPVSSTALWSAGAVVAVIAAGVLFAPELGRALDAARAILQ